jgi:hypothetical protein
MSNLVRGRGLGSDKKAFLVLEGCLGPMPLTLGLCPLPHNILSALDLCPHGFTSFWEHVPHESNLRPFGHSIRTHE